MNVYAMSTVKLNLVNFTAALSRKPRIRHQHAQSYGCWLAPIWKIYTDEMCVKNVLMCNWKY